MKKCLLVLLCLMMILPCALAEEGEMFSYNNSQYVLQEDGSAAQTTFGLYLSSSYNTLSSDGIKTFSSYYIPDTVFYNDQTISVTALRSGNIVRIFYDNRNYTTTNIPLDNTIYTFEAWVYQIDIPSSIKSIETNVFYNFPNLSTIYVAPDHNVFALIKGVLFDKTSFSLISYPRGLTAKKYAIPQGIKRVGDQAFMNNTVLNSITIPDSIVEIGVSAFQYCKELNNVVLPGSVKTIGNQAFANSSSLSNITLSEGLETIGTRAFARCGGLRSITLPESLKTIGDNAFENTSLTSLNIPASVTSIGANAFPKGCLLHVERDSYAARWAYENNYRYDYPNDTSDPLSWLNGAEEEPDTGAENLITTDTSWLN